MGFSFTYVPPEVMDEVEAIRKGWCEEEECEFGRLLHVCASTCRCYPLPHPKSFNCPMPEDHRVEEVDSIKV